MKERKPLSFLFFCINIAVQGVIFPFVFTDTDNIPRLLGVAMIFLFILSLMFSLVTIILGIIYKAETAGQRLRNRVGLWGMILVILIYVTIIVVYYSTHKRGGGPSFG